MKEGPAPPVADRPESGVSAFRQAANRDQLVLPRCRACGRLHWYPRTTCPHCLSTDIAWEESPGRGRIYAATVWNGGGTPEVVAYVDLDEGLRLLTRIVTDDPPAVSIGQRVEVLFRPADGASEEKQAFFRTIAES